MIDADKLIILTSGDGVYYHYHKRDQVELDKVGVDEIQAHINAGGFAKESMMLKV